MADLEDRFECTHRAYLNPEETRYGWACPCFERSEAERMNNWLPNLDNGLDYNPTTDAFTTRYDPDAIETFKGIDINDLHLYPIDNGSWMWYIVKDRQGKSIPCQVL